MLYHMLLSAGGFAYYRAETHVFNVIVPGFGDLRSARSRERLMDRWLESHFFKVSGLDPDVIREKVVDQCRSGADFLRTVMGSIAEQQGAPRWSDCTPTHLLYMSEIKRAIPEALFVHIIRDGRDVALSLNKLGWVATAPWDLSRALAVAALRWEWEVESGRREAASIGRDYLEVHFEDLVERPRATLGEVGRFIDHELDYDEILRVGIGSVAAPNTSFKDESQDGGFTPVGRWRRRLSVEDLAFLESLVGGTLRDLGYETVARDALHMGARARMMRAGYRSYFSLKQWMKERTPLRRLVDLGVLDT